MTAATRSDAEIRQEVQRALDAAPDLRDVGIVVSVDDGVVTLTGEVATSAERAAAVAAVRQVAGVLDIANDLDLATPEGRGRSATQVPSDTEIAQVVRQALRWRAPVPHERIGSVVTNGHVTLVGSVDSWHQREEVAHLVRRLAGVRGVTNRVEVQAPAVKVEDVQEEIEEALEEWAQEEAKRVEVAMSAGTVTLAGALSSRAEVEAVVAAVRAMRGVAAVENRLQVAPPG